MGPLEYIQAIRGEAKHKEGKLTSNSMSTSQYLLNDCDKAAVNTF